MGFKICMVGCGDFANHAHGPAVKLYAERNNGVSFAGCCDVDEKRAKAFKERFGVGNWYTDYEVMLNTEKPDAVCLLTPPEVTSNVACKILGMGYPLLVEKPPGMCADETHRIVQASAGIPNMVAFNRRYMPIVKKAMELIDSWGGADCIMDIHYRMIRVNRPDPDFSTTAIHGVDLVRHIARADYSHISLRYHNLPQYGETVANYHLNGLMSNGIVVNMDFLPMSGILTERLEINTANGLLMLYLPLGPYDMPGRLVHLADNKEVLVVCGEELSGTTDIAVLGGFYNENAKFFDAVRRGQMPDGDIATGLQAVEIAHCINQRKGEYPQ